MRPKSIRLFDGLYLAGVLIGALNVALGMTVLRPEGAAPVTEQVAAGGVSLLGLNIFAAVIALTLWYLVSRLRIAVLRWVLAAIVVFGLAGLPGVLAYGLTTSAALLVLASLLQLLSIWYLFRPDARRWFAAPAEA